MDNFSLWLIWTFFFTGAVWRWHSFTGWSTRNASRVFDHLWFQAAARDHPYAVWVWSLHVVRFDQIWREKIHETRPWFILILGISWEILAGIRSPPKSQLEAWASSAVSATRVPGRGSRCVQLCRHARKHLPQVLGRPHHRGIITSSPSITMNQSGIVKSTNNIQHQQ